MFCSNCGKEVPSGAAFCPGCGNPIKTVLNENTSQINNTEIKPTVEEELKMPPKVDFKHFYDPFTKEIKLVSGTPLGYLVKANEETSRIKKEFEKKAKEAEQKAKLEAMTPEEKEIEKAKADKKQASKEYWKEANDSLLYGQKNAEMVCPHCQTKGQVRTKALKRKKGISGGKAVGAILTGGLSILATGLSRKEGTTQAHCDNCQATWDF